METQQVECTVRPMIDGKPGNSFQGFIRIVRTPFDHKFTPWYGAVLLTCSEPEFREIYNPRAASVKLPNGKAGFVHWMGGHAQEAVLIPGHEVGEHRLLYFVGTTKCPLDE